MLNAAFIQRYLAMAYARSRATGPQRGDGYWTSYAVADAALVIFFGPLTAWLPFAAFTGRIEPRGSPITAVAVAIAGAVSFWLARVAAKSPNWRRLEADLQASGRAERGLLLWRLLTWAGWGFVHPAIWAFILPG
jgi:hypothetical protein